MTFGYPTNFRFGSRIGFPAGGGTPAFSPADVAGLYLWLKADAITGLNDGDAVATWEDSSGNNRDAVQITAGNRPIYKTNIANSLPVVRFDGTDDAMNLGDFSALTEAEGFIVVKLDNDPPTVGEGGMWTIGSSGANLHIPYTDGTIYDDFGSTARKTTANPATSMSATFVIYSAYSATNDWQNYLNGVSLYSTATSTPGFSAIALLGCGGTPFLDGDIAEFVIYSNKLAAGDRTAVITYIQDKYAL